MTQETPAQLRERLEKLDRERTQGNLSVKCYEGACGGIDDPMDGWAVEGLTYVPDYENPMLCKQDACFLASAPEMMCLIRHQAALLKEAEEVMSNVNHLFYIQVLSGRECLECVEDRGHEDGCLVGAYEKTLSRIRSNEWRD